MVLEWNGRISFPVRVSKTLNQHQTMNSKTNFKSALCGLAVGVVAMLAIGATSETDKPVGRYQVAGAGTPSVFVMVDTMTGRAWMANGTANQLRSDADFFQPKQGQ